SSFSLRLNSSIKDNLSPNKSQTCELISDQRHSSSRSIVVSQTEFYHSSDCSLLLSRKGSNG
ncbi:hypothetical protein LINPERHAP2_LOCUS9760, partial [Linum perenne]